MSSSVEKTQNKQKKIQEAVIHKESAIKKGSKSEFSKKLIPNTKNIFNKLDELTKKNIKSNKSIKIFTNKKELNSLLKKQVNAEEDLLISKHLLSSEAGYLMPIPDVVKQNATINHSKSELMTWLIKEIESKIELINNSGETSITLEFSIDKNPLTIITIQKKDNGYFCDFFSSSKDIPFILESNIDRLKESFIEKGLEFSGYKITT